MTRSNLPWALVIGFWIGVKTDEHSRPRHGPMRSAHRCLNSSIDPLPARPRLPVVSQTARRSPPALQAGLIIFANCGFAPSVSRWAGLLRPFGPSAASRAVRRPASMTSEICEFALRAAAPPALAIAQLSPRKTIIPPRNRATSKATRCVENLSNVDLCAIETK